VSNRKVVVDTSQRKGQLFKVSEYGGTFYLSRVGVGIILNDETSIGTTRSLKDAIELIKASVEGEVRNVKIEDW
jgi:hypothetical protein